MIAVPITAETLEQALADIGEANKKADLIELRLDFLREVNETTLQEMLKECTKPVIATFREKNFGATVEQTERLFLLTKAIELGAAYIDIDFDAVDSLEGIAQQKGNARIILSHHDFEGTPPLPELLKTLSEMASKNADVLKIVTLAKGEADNQTVLSLIPTAKKLGKPIVAFCMGPKGIRSRIECIKLGALFTLASLGKGKESASGQLSIEEMRKELAKQAREKGKRLSKQAPKSGKELSK